MRIGIFGGTFDPVHLGHLIAAEQSREQAHLHEVRFVPAARPPHKSNRPLTPFGNRAEMLELAIAGHPAFRIDRLEKERPGPSYTVDTLEELLRSQAGAELTLIVGSDCLPDIATWREPARIGEIADLLVVTRPGADVRSGEISQFLPAGLRVRQIITKPVIDISSHDLRRRLAEGKSVRYLVPRAVESYIEAHGLYRAG